MVVLLPLTAVGAVAIALVPRLRGPYGWLVAAAAVASMVLVPVATHAPASAGPRFFHFVTGGIHEALDRACPEGAILTHDGDGHDPPPEGTGQLVRRACVAPRRVGHAVARPPLRERRGG